MTDNDWIKQLQSMMERHEEPVGDDLWQDIEAKLPQRRKALPLWLRYATAAAVVGAVIGVGSLLWQSSDPIDSTSPDQPTITQTVDVQHDVPVIEVDTPCDEKPVQSRATSPLAHHAMPLAQHQSDVQQSEATQASPSPDTSTTEEPVQTADRDTTTAQPSAPRQPITAKEEPHFASATPNRAAAPSRQKQHFSVGFYAVNKFPNLKGNGHYPQDYYGWPPDPGQHYSHDNDSITHGGEDAAMQQGRRYAPLKANSNNATHHAPYSLGMSVSVPLTDRFAVTSGIVYTRLKSDFSSGKGNREQTLHYLGIPLGVTYSVWQWRFVNLYAIGGMQADFNIKATLKEPVLASDINIDKDRVQFSGMLGPGLQFNVTRDFGIYVEPTMRYYFNNGSDIENYFKDKPWNINLNAGLRLTLE